MNSMPGWRSAGSASTAWMIGVNRCCWWITATTAKNTTSSAVNGRASWKARPIWCSSVTPVKAVISTITNRPIRPTSATCRASPTISTSAARACTSSAAFCCAPRLRLSLAAYSASTWRTAAGNWAP